MQKAWRKFKKWYFGIPGTKQHLDALVAFLTVLLFITTLLINIRSLQSSNKPTPTPETSQRVVVVTSIPSHPNSTPLPTANTASCQKGIGPISISSPTEGDLDTDNPLCISIEYQQGNYCSSVWQYRINGGAWSDYGNDSPCFFNVQSGSTTFELNVKSLVNADTKYLKRTFTYQSTTSNSSQSAILR